MTNEQIYKMFSKLLKTLLPEKFDEIDSVEVKDMKGNYKPFFVVVIYVDGTEQEQENEINHYIDEIVGHTGEKFDYFVRFICL